MRICCASRCPTTIFYFTIQFECLWECLRVRLKFEPRLLLHACMWIYRKCECDYQTLIMYVVCVRAWERTTVWVMLLYKMGKIGINYSWWIKIICICMIASSRWRGCNEWVPHSQPATPAAAHVATATHQQQHIAPAERNYILIVFSQLR